MRNFLTVVYWKWNSITIFTHWVFITHFNGRGPVFACVSCNLYPVGPVACLVPVRVYLPVTCYYYHLLSLSIIIIYYYHLLLSFIVYMHEWRSGAGPRCDHGRYCLHLYTRAPACLPLFFWSEFISLTGDKKNSLAEGGGITRNAGRGVAQACLSHPRL